jgi:2-C-methyl-D-erythritol 4-phosphate cytidylyltransferase
MAKFAVILPAAGKSTRFKSQKRKKPFVELKGRAVWLRAAEHFVNRPDVVQTIVVVSPDDLDWFKEKFAPNLAFMNVDIVVGGVERADSVKNGLARVRPEAEFVAVHDAARPLLVPEWIDRVFQGAEKTGAAILAIPVTSTLKRASQDGPSPLPARSNAQVRTARSPKRFRGPASGRHRRRKSSAATGCSRLTRGRVHCSRRTKPNSWSRRAAR